MSQKKRVAVIGAGPSGLTAIKSCLEEGFAPVCYERNADPGGLWRYHDDDIEGVASVMRTTIINTSKEVGAFSDFPPPADFPNFMHNSKMFDYFMRYAEHFNLLKHIRNNFEVVKVEQTEDFDKTGQWIVSVKSAQTNAITKEIFDAVMVCVGHHVFPNVPTFPGQNKFKGTILHTHSLKSCDKFIGKKVVVVGIGNSGVDAAVDSTYVAEQVYLSTRRGSWIFGRLGVGGRPYDMDFSTRMHNFLNNFRSYDSICDTLEGMCEAKFDHAAYNLKPKHRALSAHPTMNDALPNTILSGRVIVKGDIERFEENGIVFSGESSVTEIDVVVLATGYHVKFPFLSDDVLQVKDNKVKVYKYMIPPHLKQNTLAIIGLIQPLGPIFPISELQNRWFVQILAGKVKLPSSQDMEKDIQCKNEMNAKRYVDSPRHTIQVDSVPFMDELAGLIGAKPNFVKMAVTDPKLFWACFSGPPLPYHYRLVGPHPWSDARKAILTVEDRIYTPLNANTKKIPLLKNLFPFLPSMKKMLFVITMGVAAYVLAKNYEDLLMITENLHLKYLN